jgi:biofilm PGA synthesis N-glycosyltransferase PgaC
VRNVSLITAVIVILAVRLNFTLWGLVGAARVIDDRRLRRKVTTDANEAFVGPDLRDVAAILSAHNEALVIPKTLDALARVLPVENIHVVSDGSTDETANVAHAFGVRMLQLMPGRGKAAALAEGIRYFKLVSRFRVVLILDADSRLDDEYLDRGLQCFADPDVVAVAGFVRTEWPGGEASWWSRFLIAYRERVYALTQYLLKYGQTWKRTNVTYIVPGFASMYRTDAIAQIDVAAPGLIIEDFNMTFELHHKRLGRVAFHPDIAAFTQDPSRLRDYIKQVKRWQLGFWQTIRRHGFWMSGFAAALALTIVELLVASLVLVLLPLALMFIVLSNTALGVPAALDGLADDVSGVFDPWSVLFFVFLADYAFTCVVAALQRRPSYLLFGLLFLPMRVVDAAIVMWTIVAMPFTKSTGQWLSPSRR